MSSEAVLFGTFQCFFAPFCCTVIILAWLGEEDTDRMTLVSLLIIQLG